MRRTYRAERSSDKSSELKGRRHRLDQRRERAATKQSLEEVISLGPVRFPPRLNSTFFRHGQFLGKQRRSAQIADSPPVA